MMQDPRDLLVFDLDGVIINSERLMRMAYAESCAASGVAAAPPVENFLECMGMPLPDIARSLGLPDRFVSGYQRISRERMDLVVLYDGAIQFLDWAQRSFRQLALITGKDRERTRLLLERFGVASFFFGLVCGDDPFPGKPDAAGLVALMAAAGARPDETALIGDSPIDVRCGRAGGVLTLGAGWGLCSPNSLVAAGAYCVFNRPAEFETWLRSRGAGFFATGRTGTNG